MERFSFRRLRSLAEPSNSERRRSKGRRLFHAHIKLVETNYLAASAPPTDEERGRWFLVHVCVRCSFRMSSGSICEQRIKVNETSNFCSLCSLVSIPFRLFVRACCLFSFLSLFLAGSTFPKREQCEAFWRKERRHERTAAVRWKYLKMLAARRKVSALSIRFSPFCTLFAVVLVAVVSVCLFLHRTLPSDRDGG